ncbi:NADPH-dependent F420 reductase [Nocardia brasiliensis]
MFLALPYSAVQKAATLIAEHAGPDTIIVETGNYYPGRDGVLPGLGDTDAPAPDTVSLSGSVRRPVVKAFNNIIYVSIRDGGRAPGSPQRFGLPIAGPDGPAKDRLSQLVDQAGFDPVDGGTLDRSWRQRPGSPVYATDLPAVELRKQLEAAVPQDAAICRANRAQFDDVTAAGYETIRGLRAQGLSFDQVIDAAAADTERRRVQSSRRLEIGHHPRLGGAHERRRETGSSPVPREASDADGRYPCGLVCVTAPGRCRGNCCR